MFHRRPIITASSIGALALIAAVALPAAAGAAEPGDDVLVFSNPSVVDTIDGASGGEYEWISAAITAAGYNVVPFDGGDGTAATWQTELESAAVFVLPEQETGVFYDPVTAPSWLSSDAFDALIDWVQAGGEMLVSGTCRDDQGGTVEVVSAATGVDYTGVFGWCDEPGTSTRWISDASLPSTLPYADGTYPLALSDFSEAQLEPLTVWYSGESCGSEVLTVGEFAAGDGRIAFEAWDYYNDTGTDQAAWNEVLAALLAGSGSASTWSPGGGGAAPEDVTATTDSGESLYAFAADGCDTSAPFRVDPGTAISSPVESDMGEGWALQGAWDAMSGMAYLPFYDYEAEDAVLAAFDPETGDFSVVGGFVWPDGTGWDDIYGLAIGPDGDAYLFAEVYDGEGSPLTLFSVDLSDATLTAPLEVDEDLLDEPLAFAAHPVTGEFYAIEEDTHELFLVDVSTAALDLVGEIDGASLDPDDSDVTALQIGSDGAFWVAYDVYDETLDIVASMLATFTLSDLTATEIGVLTDDPLYTESLLLVPGEDMLPATGRTAEGALGAATALLLLGGVLLIARRLRRTA